MTMPVLPALMGDPSAPPPVQLADIISQLDEVQVTELLAAADAAGFGVEPPAEEAPTEEGEPVEEETMEEEAPVEEEVVEEVPEEEAPDSESMEDAVEEEDEETAVAEMTELGFDSITSWTDTALDQIDEQYDALVELAKAATKSAELGADPDAIDALVTQADELRAAANEAADASKAAAKAEDARTCALEALKIERSSRVIAKLLEQASAFAETTDAPEVGPADDPAMKLWAERTAPKTGPLL